MMRGFVLLLGSIVSSATMAFALSPIELNAAIAGRFGAVADLRIVEGTSANSLRTTSGAGFWYFGDLVLAFEVGEEISICRFAVENTSENETAASIAQIVDLLRSSAVDRNCNGLLVRDSTKEAHIFVNSGPGFDGNAGAWLHSEGKTTLEVADLSDVDVVTVDALSGLVPLPTRIIALGNRRIAYIGDVGDVQIGAWSRTGSPVVRKLCVDAANHPHLVPSRTGSPPTIEDAARQVVFPVGRHDLFAYLAC